MGVEAFCSINTPDLSAVLAVVVHEHVLTDAQEAGGVHLQGSRDGHLEPSHVTRIACIFQAVLVALQEELQLKPINICFIIKHNKTN